MRVSIKQIIFLYKQRIYISTLGLLQKRWSTAFFIVLLLWYGAEKGLACERWLFSSTTNEEESEFVVSIDNSNPEIEIIKIELYITY